MCWCACAKCYLRSVTAKEAENDFTQTKLKNSLYRFGTLQLHIMKVSYQLAWVSFSEQLLLNMGLYQYLHIYRYYDKIYFTINSALNDKEEINFLLAI